MGRGRRRSYGRRVQATTPPPPGLPGAPPPGSPPPSPPPSPRRRRRVRRILVGAGAVAVAVAVVGGAVGAWWYRGVKVSTVGELDFANALRIPPLAEPRIGADGTKEFDLRCQAGETRLVDAGPSETWGLNGTYLGPTLRADVGDTVRINVTNGVDEPTTLHWHGMHLPAAMDGGPHQMVDSGASWQPRFPIRQQAATLWFHSHLLGRSRDQVTRGLAGLFILDDDNPAQVALPHDYGVDDIPLILQESRLSGGRTLVNGTLEPVLATDQARLRLRLLNASDQRIYTLGFTGAVPFHQVASDGGLLPAP